MKWLLSRLRGCLVLIGYLINTLLWALPLLLISLFKLLPFKGLRDICSSVLNWLATNWISVNSAMARMLHPYKLVVTGDTNWAKNDWYMVIANHQSWVDILILQRLFNHKIPFLKFFLKQQLIYVPVLGLAWWALDFPFMRRYSTAQLRKNPKLRGKDIEITRKACAKFKHFPVSIMNFVEGTRINPEKHAQQSSPYQHLLRPKAGGMAYALGAMPEINQLLDVTIYYPDKTPSFWEYLCGKCQTIRVHIHQQQIADSMRGDYQNDRQFKKHFQEELNHIWYRKDQMLDELITEYKKEVC